MRTRRIPGAVAMAALVLTLPGVAAATTTISTTSLPAGFAYDSLDCNSNATTGGPDYVHVPGPGTPLAGTGSLRVSFTKRSSFDLHRTSVSGTIADVTAASLSSYTAPANGVWAIIEVGGQSGTDYHWAWLQVPSTAAWSTTNLLTAATIHSYTYHSTTDTYVDDPDGTWTQFSTAHGADSLYSVDIYADTCDTALPATGSVYLDNVALDMSGASTVDFEASPASHLSIGASKSKLVYGQSVTLSTKLTRKSNGSAIPGQHALLYAKKAGSTSLAKVADVITSSSGNAQSAQSPKLNTSYLWIFSGNHTLAPSTSSTKVISVARKLTLAVVDTTLKATQKLKATGKETPAKSGSLVSVFRHNATGTFKIGAATVQADGSWALTKDVPKGTYYVYATAAADSRFIASKSRSISVTSG